MTKSRTNADNVTADIAGITAGTGITGGGTSGTVTITNDMATTIAAKGDILAGTANDAYSALTVGANGTVLTAASGQATGLEWATPSSGGMTLISTTTLSGATTTLASIPQTYNSLFVIISAATFDTSNGQLVCWTNAVNTNNVNQAMVQWNNNVGGTATGSSSAPIYLQGNQLGLRTDANNVFMLTINNYASSTTHKPFTAAGSFIGSAQAGAILASNVAGAIRSNTAITSLVFGYDNSNAANAGTILLYGVK